MKYEVSKIGESWAIVRGHEVVDVFPVWVTQLEAEQEARRLNGGGNATEGGLFE